MDENETPGSCDENEAPGSYEVGYGKPPKNTRFQKGVSGNPKGRPKKALDFDAALLREARTLVTINENGRKVRLSKHELIAKQLTNGAIKGNNSGMRLYVDISRQASERVALLEAQQAKELERSKDSKNFSTEELERLLATILEREEKDRKK
jgi:hypothetical protein